MKAVNTTGSRRIKRRWAGSTFLADTSLARRSMVAERIGKTK
jgi:hypothetical protein